MSETNLAWANLLLHPWDNQFPPSKLSKQMGGGNVQRRIQDFESFLLNELLRKFTTHTLQATLIEWQRGLHQKPRLHWGCKATAGKAAVAAQVQPPTGIGLHLQRICSLNCKPTAVEAANTLPRQSFCSAHCKPTAWEVLLQSPLQTNCNSSGSHLGFGVMTPNLIKFYLC